MSGWHHLAETKARIRTGVAQARAWHRLTRTEDELRYSYRYRLKLAEIRALKDAADRQRLLDAAAAKSKDVVAVRTYGACLPASGLMLWKAAGFALVWFDGCDTPMVWPYANLEVVTKAPYQSVVSASSGWLLHGTAE